MTQVLQNQLIHGDFYKELPKMRMKSVDMILTDLPYNITSNSWEIELDLKEMWDLFHHVSKENGAIVLTSSQPFTSKLVMSNLNEFKYEWIWQKEKGTGFLNSNKQPLREHESVLVFYKKQCKYNPQMEDGESYNRSGKQKPSPNYRETNYMINAKNVTKRFPKTIIKFSRDNSKITRSTIKSHPTQKPVELFKYLIKTYTNEGDLVLDCCAGSGTTAIACMNTKRNYICIEKNEEYFKVMQNRIKHHELPIIESEKP